MASVRPASILRTKTFSSMQAADYMAAEVEAAKTGNVTIYEGSGRPTVTPAIRQY
jgi:hypothetical protein